jgi:hypothetical protein
MKTEGPLWVRKWVDSVESRIGQPVLAGILALGWVPIVLTVAVYVLERETITGSFLFTHSLTASIIVFGPYQAYRYDKHVLPEFFDDIRAVVDEDDRASLDRIREDRIGEFRRRHFPAVFVWTIMVISVLPLNRGYFAAQGIVMGEFSYALYVAFLTNFGILSGLGLFSGWITVQSIKNVGALTLDLDPLHEDRLGGLSPMGRLAAWTALLIANGSLAIPFSLDMVTTRGGAFIVYAGIVIYIAVIAVSFLYPLWTVYKQSKAIRRSEVSDCREKIQTLQSQINPPIDDDDPEMREVDIRLQIEQLRSRHQHYQNIRSYPASVEAAGKFAFSVLLPLLFSGSKLLASGAL